MSGAPACKGKEECWRDTGEGFIVAWHDAKEESSSTVGTTLTLCPCWASSPEGAVDVDESEGQCRGKPKRTRLESLGMYCQSYILHAMSHI